MTDAGKTFDAGADNRVFVRVVGKTPAGTHATVLSAPFQRTFLAKLCRRDGKLFYTGDQEIVFPLPTVALRHIYTDSVTDPNPEFIYMETTLEGTAHLVYMGPEFGYVQQYYRICLVAQEYHGATATDIQLAPPPLPLLQVGMAVPQTLEKAPQAPEKAPQALEKAPQVLEKAPQAPKFWPPRVLHSQDVHLQNEISFKSMVAKWCQVVPLVNKSLTSKPLISKPLVSNLLTSNSLTSKSLTPTVQTPQEDGAAPCGYCGDCNACWNRERRGGRGGQRRKM